MIMPDGTTLPDAAEGSSGLIERVHLAYRLYGSMLSPHGVVCWLPTAEVAKYCKLARTRENALAPGRRRNRSDEDHLAGQRKWDALFASVRQRGFLPKYPVEFVISSDPKLRLHQGHHRIGVAIALAIPAVPVRFWFAHLGKPKQ